MNEGSVGRRYARAIFSIARDEGLVEQIGRDLAAFARQIEIGGKPLQDVLYTPLYTPSERAGVISRLIPGLGLHPHTGRLIGLLVEKNRLEAFPDIVRAYGELADDAAGRVRASLTSTAPLTPAMRQQVVDALSKATGRQVVLETQVDPSLLGGMVARVGTWLFDASVKARLEQLKLNLTSNHGPA